MDVKACDNCKKFNTEVALFRLIEGRTSRDRGRLATNDDPLAGFSLSVNLFSSDEEIMNAQLTKALCKPCAEKRIAELLTVL